MYIISRLIFHIFKVYTLKKDISKFRKKNDFKYKESIEVPFENAKDKSGK